MPIFLRHAIATRGRRKHVQQLFCVLLLAGSAQRAAAQSQSSTLIPQARHPLAASASRKELESLANDLERMAVDTTVAGTDRHVYQEQAKKLRIRLRDGDFQVGDQIQLNIQGDTSLRGTFSVQRGLVLTLPNISEIKLQGVLRSELRERVHSEVAQYVRNPQLSITPLLQVSVSGEVSHPGFYRVAAETPLSDLIMQAGGPTATANLTAIAVRRGEEEILSARAVSDAMASGSTLDQIGLRAGDEIHIPQKRSFSGTMWLQSLAVVSGLLVTALSLRHR